MAESTSSTEQEKGQEKAPEARYDGDELVEHAYAWFGESPHLVAAAVESAPRKTLTKEQAKQLIQRVKKHEVPPDDGTPQAEEEE